MTHLPSKGNQEMDLVVCLGRMGERIYFAVSVIGIALTD